jgi:hypothetical protein
MAKHAKPAWGNLGVICVRGHGQTDEQFIEGGMVPGEQGRGDRGCVLSDAQFERLAVHLTMTDPNQETEVRERLDSILGFYLRSRLYEAATPSQAKRNAALAIVTNHIGAFCAAAETLAPLPEWPLTELPSSEAASPYDVFLALPDRLCALADITLETAQGDAARLLTLSERAMALAAVLHHLDHASQDDVSRELPFSRDYGMDTFAEIVQLTRKLGDAVRMALESGRRRGGPRAFEELVQAVDWLREIYERCGGAFTHTPREKTHYDGRPHSAAGRFVLAFFEMCDPELSPQTISSTMAKVISSRPHSPGEVFLID